MSNQKKKECLIHHMLANVIYENNGSNAIKDRLVRGFIMENSRKKSQKIFHTIHFS